MKVPALVPHVDGTSMETHANRVYQLDDTAERAVATSTLMERPPAEARRRAWLIPVLLAEGSKGARTDKAMGKDPVQPSRRVWTTLANPSTLLRNRGPYRRVRPAVGGRYGTREGPICSLQWLVVCSRQAASPL